MSHPEKIRKIARRVIATSNLETKLAFWFKEVYGSAFMKMAEKYDNPYESGDELEKYEEDLAKEEESYQRGLEEEANNGLNVPYSRGESQLGKDAVADMSEILAESLRRLFLRMQRDPKTKDIISVWTIDNKGTDITNVSSLIRVLKPLLGGIVRNTLSGRYGDAEEALSAVYTRLFEPGREEFARYGIIFSRFKLYAERHVNAMFMTYLGAAIKNEIKDIVTKGLGKASDVLNDKERASLDEQSSGDSGSHNKYDPSYDEESSLNFERNLEKEQHIPKKDLKLYNTIVEKIRSENLPWVYEYITFKIMEGYTLDEIKNRSKEDNLPEARKIFDVLLSKPSVTQSLGNAVISYVRGVQQLYLKGEGEDERAQKVKDDGGRNTLKGKSLESLYKLPEDHPDRVQFVKDMQASLGWTPSGNLAKDHEFIRNNVDLYSNYQEAKNSLPDYRVLETLMEGGDIDADDPQDTIQAEFRKIRNLADILSGKSSEPYAILKKGVPDSVLEEALAESGTSEIALKYLASSKRGVLKDSVFAGIRKGLLAKYLSNLANESGYPIPDNGEELANSDLALMNSNQINAAVARYRNFFVKNFPDMYREMFVDLREDSKRNIKDETLSSLGKDKIDSHLRSMSSKELQKLVDFAKDKDSSSLERYERALAEAKKLEKARALREQAEEDRKAREAEERQQARLAR